MSEKPMDKMREEYEKWLSAQGGDERMVKIFSPFLFETFQAGYQAATAEAEKYRVALEEIAVYKFENKDTEMEEIFQSPYLIESRSECAHITKQALQKD
jgi:hypothetical protein